MINNDETSPIVGEGKKNITDGWKPPLQRMHQSVLVVEKKGGNLIVQKIGAQKTNTDGGVV